MDASDLGLVTDFDPVARIEADGTALADAAERDMGARVEHCPDWSVADLVWRVREVHWFWGAIVREGLDDPQRVARVARPDDDRQLLADYRQGVGEITRALAAADPFAPVWTWGQRRGAGFVVRHQVQEAAVHRWDAENATGRPSSLDTAAAADSVDEFLTHSLPSRADRLVVGVGPAAVPLPAGAGVRPHRRRRRGAGRAAAPAHRHRLTSASG